MKQVPHGVRKSLCYHARYGLETRRPVTFRGPGDGAHGEA